MEMIRTRSAHRLIEHVPAPFEHLDAPVVFAVDRPVVRALVDQPQELEVDGVEEPLLDRRFVQRGCGEDDLAGFEARQVGRANAAQRRNRVARDPAADDEIESRGAAALGHVQHAVRHLVVVDAVAGVLKRCGVRDLDEAQQLVRARTLRLELRFDGHVAVAVDSAAQDFDHLALGRVHVFATFARKYGITRAATSSGRSGVMRCSGADSMEPLAVTRLVIFGKYVCSGSVGTTNAAGPGASNSSPNPGVASASGPSCSHGMSYAEKILSQRGKPRPDPTSHPTYAPPK